MKTEDGDKMLLVESTKGVPCFTSVNKLAARARKMLEEQNVDVQRSNGIVVWHNLVAWLRRQYAIFPTDPKATSRFELDKMVFAALFK